MAQVDDSLMPLTACTPAPSVNEQNRRALDQLEVLQFESVVFKERNGPSPTFHRYQLMIRTTRSPPAGVFKTVNGETSKVRSPLNPTVMPRATLYVSEPVRSALTKPKKGPQVCVLTRPAC